jgi:hypothetical protein
MPRFGTMPRLGRGSPVMVNRPDHRTHGFTQPYHVVGEHRALSEQRSCYPATPAMGSGRGHHPHFCFQLALAGCGFPRSSQVSLFQTSSEGIAVHHHRRSPGPFKVGSGGMGMYLCQTLGTMLEGCIVYAKRSRPGFGLVGVSLDGSAHQPPW